jgi:hypothetical protein
VRAGKRKKFPNQKGELSVPRCGVNRFNQATRARFRLRFTSARQADATGRLDRQLMDALVERRGKFTSRPTGRESWL